MVRAEVPDVGLSGLMVMLSSFVILASLILVMQFRNCWSMLDQYMLMHRSGCDLKQRLIGHIGRSQASPISTSQSENENEMYTKWFPLFWSSGQFQLSQFDRSRWWFKVHAYSQKRHCVDTLNDFCCFDLQFFIDSQSDWGCDINHSTSFDCHNSTDALKSSSSPELGKSIE